MKSKVIALTLATLLGTTVLGGVQAQGADSASKANIVKKVICQEQDNDCKSDILRKFTCIKPNRPGKPGRPNRPGRPCRPSIGNGCDTEVVPPSDDNTEIVPPVEDDTEVTPPEVVPPVENDTEIAPPEVAPPSDDNTDVVPPVDGDIENIPGNGNDDTVVNDKFMAEVEQAIFKIVNEEREKAGVKQLSYNSTMEKYARIKSQDMGDKNYFSHEDLSGNLITTQMKADGVSYRAWGENIAYIGGNTNATELAKQFMTNWMNSSGHRANILSTNFESIGVGVYKIGNKVYATQEFYR